MPRRTAVPRVVPLTFRKWLSRREALSLPATRSPLRAAITAAYRRPEPEAVPPLVAAARLPAQTAAAAQALARRLAQVLRDRKSAAGREGLVQGLLQEYSLSSQEGVALMCLAEALLRIPDPATRDALIRDKIGTGQWHEHLGRSPSLFVNAATWGLLLTGKLVATHSESGLSSALARLVGKGGEPLIRKSVDRAMRLMGEQFVTGETIGEALANARSREAQGFRYSYDMLGEAALTAADAARYRRAYEDAIDAIGRASAGPRHPRRAGHLDQAVGAAPALQPGADRSRRQRALSGAEGLAVRCAPPRHRPQHRRRGGRPARDLARPARAPLLRARARRLERHRLRRPGVPEALPVRDRRARRSRRAARGHRLMVRLVKGAYWDSEIKRAQVDGLDGYPVYTRKAYTDVAYLACARRLLAAPDAVFAQFATHNAHTLAAIYELAGGADAPADRYEFQCLHGMGEPLYEQVVGPVADGKLGRPCRIYAPVGTHETLLAYLVRRLLENGANTSFVNRIADASVPIDELVEDPVTTVERIAAAEAEAAARRRPAASGDPAAARDLRRGAAQFARPRPVERGRARAARRRLCERAVPRRGRRRRCWRPATRSPRRWRDGDDAGAAPAQRCAIRPTTTTSSATSREATLADVDRAVAAARDGAAAWAATPAADRAAMLERAADSLEADLPRLLGLLAREAGKTYPNGIAEVREAVDFLRFYAAQARRDLGGGDVAPLGPVVCISPWNFPLAIFTGQVAAALAAGNPVLAKPAEQTPLIAAEMVRRLHRGRRAGVGAAAAARPRRNRRRRARRRRARPGRHVHRLDRRRAPAAEEPLDAPERRRPRRHPDRRDRRAERDAGRLVGARRAGRRPTSSPRRSTAPASAARRCACCASRPTAPTASSRC